eukprot:1104656-Pyramimonas_sp.AAC.1
MPAGVSSKATGGLVDAVLMPLRGHGPQRHRTPPEWAGVCRWGSRPRRRGGTWSPSFSAPTSLVRPPRVGCLGIEIGGGPPCLDP